MSKRIHQPHDSFVRKALSDLQTACDLLKAHLPIELIKQIDWNTLQLANKSFVKKELKHLYSDVVYRCLICGQEAYIYLLIEHQSTPDPLLPFRVLQYDVALMEEHVAQGNKKLPIIVNLCLYAGKESPYPYSVDIYECFELPNLARKEMFKPLKLIDLTVLSEEELAQNGHADLVEMLLKQGVLREFLSWIKSHREFMVKLLNRFYGDSGIIYMLELDEENNAEQLVEAILASVPSDKKDKIMTAAQQLRQQGMQQGIQQGMQQGIQQGMQQGIQQGIEARNLEIAKSMLFDLKLGIDIVQKATKLDRKEIERIVKASASKKK